MASWNEIWNTQLTIPSAKPNNDAKTAKSVVALLFKTVPPESEKDLQDLRRYIIDTLNQSVAQFNGTLTQSSQVNAGNALTFTTKEINKPLKQDSTETKPSTAQVQYQLKIQASYNLMLHIAEEMGLEKLTTSGDFEPFSYDQRFNFQHLSQEDKFFMASEKLRMLLWKLDHLIVDKDVRFGSVSSLKSGERLISKLKREGVIESVLCLHDNRLRKELHENWIAFSNKSPTGTTWNWVTRQPFHKIRNYFGEKIAMYFAFLEFYTTWLIFPSILGILVTVLGLHELLPLYTLGITIWGCLFCEFWRRKSDDLAYEWRVDLFEEEEEVRPEFVGDIVTDPVTGHKLLYYDPAKRYIQYAKSLPVMLLMLLFAIGGMVFFYKVDDWIDPAHTTYTAIVLYGAFIPAFSYLYKIVAVKLNDLENYRTETEYENHLNIKLFSFEFFNCFCLLFYTAFWKQDIEYLRSLLIGILITRQILGNVLESLLPWYTVKTKLVLEKKRLKRQQGQQTDSQGVDISSIESEQLLAPYEQTYDDYLEMIVQFGYMTLFAVAFPLAPLWAFLNNVVEIRSDAFKLIHASQRPRPQVAENIGIWLKCLEFLNVLAIISNLYFIFFVADNLDNYFADGGKKIWTFVIAEHLFIGFRWLVSFVSSQIATPHLQKIWQQERQVIRKIKKKAN